MTTIRLARESDRAQLAALRHALWPESPAEHHAGEIDAIFAGEWSRIFPYTMFVAETEAGELVGFVDVTMRSYAEGCDEGRPAGYLEGWYVAAGWRRRGIGGELVRAAEAWAREQGCTEMGSDTWLDNEVSQRAHEALGFEVTDRIITFRKGL